MSKKRLSKDEQAWIALGEQLRKMEVENVMKRLTGKDTDWERPDFLKNELWEQKMRPPEK